VGLTVALQDEHGRTVESVGDSRNLLHSVLPGPDDSRYPWAGTIDWYGDTTFNRTQAERLRTEWFQLRAAVPDPDTQALLLEIQKLIDRCAAGTHLYVKFWGD
jgi:hypothetical protein